MFDWLFVLLGGGGFGNAAPPQKDYIGVVAAEVAYADLLPSTPAVKPRPIDPNCPTCKGVGKVPSGDGHAWTKCPTCQPLVGAPTDDIKTPKSDPDRYKAAPAAPTATKR